MNFKNNYRFRITDLQPIFGGDNDPDSNSDEDFNDGVDFPGELFGGEDDPDHDRFVLGGEDDPDHDRFVLGGEDDPDHDRFVLGGEDDPDHDRFVLGGEDDPDHDRFVFGGEDDPDHEIYSSSSPPVHIFTEEPYVTEGYSRPMQVETETPSFSEPMDVLGGDDDPDHYGIIPGTCRFKVRCDLDILIMS